MKIVYYLLFLTSCAWHPVQENLAQREVNRLMYDFLSLSNKHKLNLKAPPITFVVMEEKFPKFKGAVGLCKNKAVYLDQKWWRETTLWDKEQVLFHELGHCLLDLKHQKGIMGQKPIPSDIYYKHRATLINQMFNQKLRMEPLR